ncbi:MAG: glycosyltransferase, partial [Opitutales bacterium]
PAADGEGLPAVFVASGEAGRRAFYAGRGPGIRRVLCFGNVPPPVRLSAEVGVYFHNMALLRGPAASPVSWLKMAYVAWRAGHADFFLVQSGLVRAALAARLPSRTRVLVAPFFAVSPPPAVDFQDAARWSRFAYVSDAYPHKNHARLLEAWSILAARGQFPELHLTVYGPYPGALARIARAREAGLRVVNHGYVRPTELYEACGYQVYPSLMESFGLGLVEAAGSGCAIIASDLPYVREVVEPHGSFDPGSSASIADVVGRFVGRPSTPSAIRTRSRLDDIVAWLRDGRREALG